MYAVQPGYSFRKSGRTYNDLFTGIGPTCELIGSLRKIAAVLVFKIDTCNLLKYIFWLCNDASVSSNELGTQWTSSIRSFEWHAEISPLRHIWKSIFMDFHVKNCIKTCQREQVNKFLLKFLHPKCCVNNFEQLFYNFTRGWETGKEPPLHHSYSQNFSSFQDQICLSWLI